MCGGYDRKEKTRFIDAKWCFHCRKRLIHTWVVFFPEPMSYYGPTAKWECAKCGKDETGFPGTEWWYGE
jgi:hypothetical protein